MRPDPVGEARDVESWTVRSGLEAFVSITLGTPEVSPGYVDENRKESGEQSEEDVLRDENTVENHEDREQCGNAFRGGVDGFVGEHGTTSRRRRLMWIIGLLSESYDSIPVVIARPQSSG